MATFQTFARDLKLATKDLEPAAINQALAAFAKEELRKAIASGEASSTYERYVNGRKGAAEETVQAPGPILYEFTNWPLIIRDALAELLKRAPRRTGRYAGGFVVLANDRPARDFANISPEAEVIIFNVRPYTRRIETVAEKGVGRRHFDSTRRVLASRYRDSFTVDMRFLEIPSGIHADVPYRLKRSQGRRRTRQAGNVLTYPSLIINMVD